MKKRNLRIRRYNTYAISINKRIYADGRPTRIDYKKTKIRVGDEVLFTDNSYLDETPLNKNIKDKYPAAGLRGNVAKSGTVISVTSKEVITTPNYSYGEYKSTRNIPLIVKMDNGDVIHCGVSNVTKLIPYLLKLARHNGGKGQVSDGTIVGVGGKSHFLILDEVERINYYK